MKSRNPICPVELGVDKLVPLFIPVERRNVNNKSWYSCEDCGELFVRHATGPHRDTLCDPCRKELNIR